MKKKLVLTIVMLFALFNVNSENFNVSNASEFQIALTSSEYNGENDVINVAVGSYSITSTLTFYSDEAFSLTITGANSSTTVLDGGNSIEIMNIQTVASSGNVNISNITFTHGNSTHGGIGIDLESSTANISNCSFTNNNASDFGGGLSIYTNTGEIYIDNCTFEGNTATGNDAGGLYVGTTSGLMSLTNSTFNNNQALGDDAGGSMLYSDNAGTAIMHGNTYTNNSANEDAGGAMVYLLGDGSQATIYNNYFENNHAYLGGGGIWIRMPGGGNVSYTNNEHIDNSTDIGAGAGFLLELQINGDLEFNENYFENNEAGLGENAMCDGGGAWFEHGAGTLNIYNNDFFNNYAYNNGGAIFIYTEEGTINLSRNRIANNESDNVGGGLSFATNSGSLNSSHNSYYGNDAASTGGGSYLYFDNAAASGNISNDIYWANTPESFDFSGPATVQATFSGIEGGTGQSYFGTGCIDQNPLFENAANNNLLLSWANYPVNDETKSPCIDAGDPGSPNDPDASIADMGAYYYGAGIGIPDEKLQSQIKIYPNPASDYINFDINKENDFIIEIFDSKGCLIESKANCNEFDLYDYLPSIYFAKITVDGKVYTDRFIVTKTTNN